MLRYILSGKDKDVLNIIKENRIRVQRGNVEFTPVPEPEPEEEDTDTKDIPANSEDSKAVDGEDSKDLPITEGKGCPKGDKKESKK